MDSAESKWGGATPVSAWHIEDNFVLHQQGWIIFINQFPFDSLLPVLLKNSIYIFELYF